MKPIFPHLIDNSIRKVLVKCQKAAHYRYELGLQAVDNKRVDLVAGKAFAKGCEVARRLFYLSSYSQDAAMREAVEALHASYGDFRCPADSNKTPDKVGGALMAYFEKYPMQRATGLIPYTFPDGKLGVEMYFEHDLLIEHPDDDVLLKYCGNFDALMIDLDDGGLWVMDEKTSSQMGPKWVNQWPLDSQMTGYVWGAGRMLLDMGITEEIKGAIIGGVAIKKYDCEVARFPTYRPDWMVERWYDQLLNDLAQWKLAYEGNSHNMNLDHSCAYYNNPCEFAPLCLSKQPEKIMHGGLYEVKFWNPKERDL